jgi:hypothetical protein
MRTHEEILAGARDRRPFSNGTEGYGWQANWCDRCLVDAPFRNGLNKSGCPLLLVALSDMTPAEWLDGPRDEEGRYSIEDQYHCVEFRAPGGGRGGGPRPKPEPPDMDGLFPRPERRVRMYVQPELQSGRRVLEPST